MAKILVVEDSADNMKLFRTVLTLKGHQVIGMAGGDGLLSAIRLERAVLAGSSGYITKPIDIRAFPEQIHRALNGNMPAG